MEDASVSRRARTLIEPISQLIPGVIEAMKASPLREAVKGRFYPFAEARSFVRAKSETPLSTQFSRLVASIQVLDGRSGVRY
jgi:hypothetical protein